MENLHVTAISFGRQTVNVALVPFNSNSEVSPQLCRGTHRGLTLLRSRKMGRVILHDTSSLPSPPFVKGEGRIAAALGGSRCYGHLGGAHPINSRLCRG